MIIKKMTATFGGLDHATLEFADGLNVIHAPNEAGKSTWCGFLRAMLYGISTRDRDKKGFLAEKNRYQPWSGAPMEGEVQLVWQGREITLRRFAKGSTPFGGFSAVYTGTQEPVPQLTAQNCGEVLLGVSREVWERSAFIGSAPTLAIDGTNELERRISALLSSGQEDVSFSQTQSRLKEWLRYRQHNRTGLIPRMEAELAQTEDTLSAMDRAHQRLTHAQQEHRILSQRHEELTQQAAIHRHLAQRQLNTRYAQACAEDDDAQRQLTALLRRQEEMGTLPQRPVLLQAQDDLRYLTIMDEELVRFDAQLAEARRTSSAAATPPADSSPFAGMTPEQALTHARQEQAKAQAISRRIGSARMASVWGSLGALAAGGAFAGIGCLLSHALFPWLWLGLALSALLGTACLTLYSRRRRTLANELQSLLAHYGAALPEQIPEKAEAYCRTQEQQDQHRRTVLRLEQELDQRQDRREKKWQELLRLIHTFAPQAGDIPACRLALTQALDLEASLDQCRSRAQLTARHREDLRAQGGQEINTLEELAVPTLSPEQVNDALARVCAGLSAAESQQAMAQGELLALGDRAGLEARRAQLLDRLQRRREEYHALELALAALEQANARMQERFAPELNRLAGEIFEQLTAGRYCAISLDRSFEASAQSRDSVLPRSWLALSRGTADQLYLAVRLAVCRLCLPEEDPCPLVLDDALLTFDDDRMARAVRFLAQSGRQVLLFSCQQREHLLGVGKSQALHS
ncbi:MAG: AAA family ATPase [Oscillospiraceae bacterium]|nr:AAA family ATPase [Oscillospiraceae bacterium]